VPLNPQVEALLAALAGYPAPDPATASVAEMRAANDTPMAAGLPIAMARVETLAIPLPGRTLVARLYVPEGADNALPLTLFFHGGGWAVGTLDTHDATVRALARASGSAMLSLAYRLAPEHPYPAPVEDCFEALCWAAGQSAALGVDAARLAVAGDSAGANLAAACAILVRDRCGPTVRHQLLLYPVTDRDYARASYRENGGGEYFLSTGMMDWFWRQYLGETASQDAPLALLARRQDLAGLPPATVIVAEYDPLRDEGLAYAGGLEAAGVPVSAEIAPGMIHGFCSMFEAVPDALGWIDRGGQALAADLAP
jgi:acetyl esterase